MAGVRDSSDSYKARFSNSLSRTRRVGKEQMEKTP